MENKILRYNRVLAIAGSDSGGGAGIQADIKTISANGCYAASAITAVTVQNTLGVTAVHGIPADVVGQQIDAVLTDIGADAIKIGMLHSADVARTVAMTLDRHSDCCSKSEAGKTNIVLDPVMLSTSGHRLMSEEGIEVMKSMLLPVSRVITPNIPEAQLLLGTDKSLGLDDMHVAAKELSDMYSTSVLLKGGHLEADRLLDVFYDAEAGEFLELPSERIGTRNTHGTGCTLSSALASMLAKGMQMGEAVRCAKEYIDNAIAAGAGYNIGKGHGPLHHFWNRW